jgi:hypothetical protein
MYNTSHPGRLNLACERLAGHPTWLNPGAYGVRQKSQ